MLDTRRSIETPEGVELGLRLAGPIVRGYAYLIDLLIRIAIGLVFWFVFVILGKFGIGLYLIFLFLLMWFYFVVFEVYNSGMSPGKKLMGIKVVRDDGTEINLQSSLVRNLLRFVDMLPVIGPIPLYGVGLISILFNRDFKRLGDLTAGTIVIYADTQREKSSNIKAMPPQVPPIPLTADEQKAVIQYAERLDLFTPQRCSELANIVSELTNEQNEKGVHSLLRYANWMMGRR